MKDYNKEIRNLTEAANNLYEQGGWPGGFQYIPRILRGLIERHFFLKWVEDNPTNPIVIMMTLLCGGDKQCMYEYWVKAGKPRPEEPDDDDDQEENDITPTTSPKHPLQRDRHTMQAPPSGNGGGIG